MTIDEVVESGNRKVFPNPKSKIQNPKSPMPQAWIAIFFILLAVTELYESAKDITLPFPIYLVLGTVLAVASNYQQQTGFGQTQKVTLQEIKEPNPVIATSETPLLTVAKNNEPESN
jgi:hypothetical protein